MVKRKIFILFFVIICIIILCVFYGFYFLWFEEGKGNLKISFVVGCLCNILKINFL